MTDDRVSERLRALERERPSAEARVRMFEGVTRRARARKRARIVASGAAAVAVAVLAVWLARPERAAPHAQAPQAPRPAQAVPHAPPSTPQHDTVVHLAAQDTYALPHATLLARNDVAVAVGAHGVRLEGGTVAVDGALEIEGGACRASIDGQCEVTRFSDSLRFVVEAGEVRAAQPPGACRIIDLDDPSTGIDLDDPSTGADLDDPSAGAEPSHAHAHRPHAVDPSELAQQTEAYRAAVALSGHDDAGALHGLRAMQSRWPRGSLAPEVDFQVVRVLVHMGRAAEARDAARTFLRRHPRSTRAPDMQRLIDSEGDAR